MKKVYIVRGSEDGNLAVCSNIKKAYAIAYDYACSDSAANSDENTKLALSYSQVCRKFKNTSYVSITDHESSFGDASIEYFILNQG